ncbi:MAG TPA: ribokinase [Anaerolineales bacterium]|nr:ribokinase [Anaerolineales bacterium]
MTGKIMVVGSFVYDLIVWLPYFPRKGETLLASEFKMYPGGKGFNQAVSARRCGAQVSMLGKVGADQFGNTFISILEREGIDHQYVIQDTSTATSLGIPMINPQGENSIIGIPRANTLVSPSEVMHAANHIVQHKILLLQLEIPLAASLAAARLAHQAGAAVILNPAPAAFPLSDLLPQDSFKEPVIDWLVPNEIEAEMLSGISIHSPEEAVKSALLILAHGVRNGVVITMGSKGVVAVTHSAQYHVPAFKVNPVDPTGAGDAFCGAFAAALSEGMKLEKALRFASAAGALSVTVAGAEPSLPDRSKIQAFLHDQGVYL